MQEEYNRLLKRYYDGIKYLTDHTEEQEKWLPELDRIVDELGKMVSKYNIPEENILKGF